VTAGSASVGAAGMALPPPPAEVNLVL
jgi:hypothetical protein